MPPSALKLEFEVFQLGLLRASSQLEAFPRVWERYDIKFFPPELYKAELYKAQSTHRPNHGFPKNTSKRPDQYGWYFESKLIWVRSIDSDCEKQFLICRF
jgi:hypothetical protein